VLCSLHALGMRVPYVFLHAWSRPAHESCSISFLPCIMHWHLKGLQAGALFFSSACAVALTAPVLCRCPHPPPRVTLYPVPMQVSAAACSSRRSPHPTRRA
jgi:hypothetical protein